MKLDTYHKSYLAAVTFLKANSNSDTQVMGSAVLGFEFGYDRVLDDVRFGFRTGKRPHYLVINDVYEDAINHYRAGGEGEELARHMNDLLTREYELVYDENLYRIYFRRGALGCCK
jgi:hypothetical protein